MTTAGRRSAPNQASEAAAAAGGKKPRKPATRVVLAQLTVGAIYHVVDLDAGEVVQRLPLQVQVQGWGQMAEARKQLEHARDEQLRMGR